MKSILQTKNSTDYLENIKVLLNSKLCSHELKVEFAVFAASDLEEYYDATKYPKVKAVRQRCLELATKWLVDKNSVTQEELRVAAADAAVAAYAAAYAADVAANAANAAAYAANAAAYAANAVTIAKAAADAAVVAYAANAATVDADADVAAAYTTASTAYLQKLYNWLFTRLTKDLNTNTIEVLYGSN